MLLLNMKKSISAICFDICLLKLHLLVMKQTQDRFPHFLMDGTSLAVFLFLSFHSMCVPLGGKKQPERCCREGRHIPDIPLLYK